MALRMAGDSAAWAIGLLLGMVVRFDGFNDGWDPFFPVRFFAGGAVIVVSVTVWTVAMGRRFGWIRYGSFEEVIRLAIGDGVAVAVVLVVNRLAPYRLLP